MSQTFSPATAFEPGMRVRHPGQPDWGPGTVQSVVGHRVTVTFEDAGKVLVNTAVVALEAAGDDTPSLRLQTGSTT